MSAMNPPCNAELTFMRLLPVKLHDMTEAALKLSSSMDRLAAALERHNEQELTVQTVQAPISVETLDRAFRNAFPHTDAVKHGQQNSSNLHQDVPQSLLAKRVALGEVPVIPGGQP